jgi:hypothetical protein
MNGNRAIMTVSGGRKKLGGKIMENLVLEMINEMVDNEECFVINDDGKAEWALNKIAEEKAEMQRMINVANSMIMKYQEKIEVYQKQFENKTTFLKEQLRQYFETVPHKITKTQETYKLPSGILKLKKQNPEYIRDEEKLLKWVKANKISYVKTKESVNWAELKKELKFVGNKALTEDGEIVDGITVSERPSVFEIDI